MAITLDELLGRNKMPQEQERKQQSFPSYEEFQSSRMNNAPSYDQFKNIQNSVEENENYPKFQNYTYTQNSVQSQNLYEFTRRDNDRLTQQELYAKLSHTNDSCRPVFDKEEVAQIVQQKHGIFTHRVEKEDVKEETKKKLHLNFKGKLIIAAYVAVVAIVAGLIIANSSNLNLGKATTPSSSLSDTSFVQIIK